MKSNCNLYSLFNFIEIFRWNIFHYLILNVKHKIFEPIASLKWEKKDIFHQNEIYFFFFETCTHSLSLYMSVRSDVIIWFLIFEWKDSQHNHKLNSNPFKKFFAYKSLTIFINFNVYVSFLFRFVVAVSSHLFVTPSISQFIYMYDVDFGGLLGCHMPSFWSEFLHKTNRKKKRRK